MSKYALVCGSARCLWDDLTYLKSLSIPLAALPSHRWPIIVGVNYAGVFMPRVHHMVSLHAEFIGLARRMRTHSDNALRDHQPAIITHAPKAAEGVDRVWDLPTTGSSSLFGVRVALALGADRVIVCGAPLDSAGHFYDDPSWSTIDWGGATGGNTREHWREAARNEFQDRVRACSGFTNKLLGGPEWWIQ